jgi:hypothetical protein
MTVPSAHKQVQAGGNTESLKRRLDAAVRERDRYRSGN